MRRVAVFVDWQNTYGCAREAFQSEHDPSRYGNVRLRALAELLTEKGDAGDKLVHVGVYRGEPSPRDDPQTHAAHMRQRQAWQNDLGEMLRFRSRPLRYLHGRSLKDAEEKGIDVQLAIDAMVMGLRKEYDLAVLATADTDLVPVVEGLLALKEETGSPDVAVIGWAGTSQHLEVTGVPVRWIGKKDYEAIREKMDFNVSAADRYR
jgi:uncharacterized LabA/DUF88 family protein